jgi:hypothetical protein
MQVELPYRAAADAEEQDAADAAADAMDVDGEEADEATQAGSNKKGKGEALHQLALPATQHVWDAACVQLAHVACLGSNLAWTAASERCFILSQTQPIVKGRQLCADCAVFPYDCPVLRCSAGLLSAV